MNKRSSVLALILALFVALIVPRIVAQAQTDQASTLDPATQAKVQQHLQHISSELNLTDDQKTQLKPILQNEVQQLKAVDNDTSLNPDQKKAKARDIHQSAKSQMATILTPDQQKKLASMKEEAMENWK
jgi:Spy/CpxP family protein refolding chaperone